MPLDLVKVERVDPVPTSKPGCTNYTVTAITIEGTPRTVQYQTINEWKASICDQARKNKTAIWVTWKSSNFRSKDITTVSADDTRWRFA